MNSLKSTFEFLNKEFKNLNLNPSISITLGSGLSSVFNDLKSILKIKYNDIPGVPTSTVKGHSGVLDILEYEKKHIAVMRGRIHPYEYGNTPDDSVRILRVLALLGVKKSILTNAAGSLHLKNKVGSLMLIKDHIKLSHLTPLTSLEAKSIGPTFVDMTDAYSERIRDMIKKISKKNKINIAEGVYAYMHGPQYETSAEIKMLKTLGADAVGMSTALETIALKQLNIEVACISIMTNYGTGIKKSVDHSSVTDVASKAAKKLDIILKELVKNL